MSAPDYRFLPGLFPCASKARKAAKRATEPGWVAGEPVETEDGWAPTLVREPTKPSRFIHIGETYQTRDEAYAAAKAMERTGVRACEPVPDVGDPLGRWAPVIEHDR